MENEMIQKMQTVRKSALELGELLNDVLYVRILHSLYYYIPCFLWIDLYLIVSVYFL